MNMENEAEKESQLPDKELKATVEAIIYVVDEPATVQQLASALEGYSTEDIRRALDELLEEYRREDRGIEIRELAGGYKMFTKPQYHESIRKFVKQLTPPLRLSMAALETLATIAYRQPITVPEIQQIRGVHAAGVLKTLLERKLITTAGRKNVLGRPILYKTTKEFLMQFGLNSLQELPSIEEFEELARTALSEPAGTSPVPSAGAEAEPSAQETPHPAADDIQVPASQDPDGA